jgi:hypothetical protein
VSPYNAYTGRQPSFLPDLENIDFSKEGENSSGLREERIRQAGITAITQSTAVAKVNRALKTKTTLDGSQYTVGQLVDYHRPTHDKDSHGGWNGPCRVIRNEPERGQLICMRGGREAIVRYPDARLTLFVESIYATMIHDRHEAMDIVIDYVSRLTPGKAPITFGFPAGDHLTSASKNAPKVFLALQYVIRNMFRIPQVTAVRLGRSFHKVAASQHATGSTLIYYYDDQDPEFHYYETKDTALNVYDITGSTKSRIMQCLTGTVHQRKLHHSDEIAEALMPTGRSSQEQMSHGNVNSDPEPMSHGNVNSDNMMQPDASIGSELPSIPEGDNEDAFVLQQFYDELESEEALPIYELSEEELQMQQPIPLQMMP